MKKEKVKERIITAIKENFTIKDEKFIEEDGFIEWSIDEDFEYHEDFGNKLSEILNKVFPDRKHSIVINNCDTLEDILCNNFKFDKE